MGTRRRYSGFGVQACAFIFFTTASTLAETPTAPAGTPTAPPASAGPNASGGSDVVRLKNGGLVRGKISELLPGASVTIISASGKTHEFPMADVSYAGPETEDPTGPPSSAPPTPPTQPPSTQAGPASAASESPPSVSAGAATATVHLASNPPGLTFHREDVSTIVLAFGRTALTKSFARWCESPCRLSIAPGTERIALSLDGKSPVSAGVVTIPPGESTLRAVYTSKRETRLAGAAVVAFGLVVGTVLIYTARSQGSCDQSGCPKPDAAQAVGGGVIALGGVLLGVGLANVSDVANIKLFPGPPSRSEQAGLPPLDPGTRPNLPGLVLRGSF